MALSGQPESRLTPNVAGPASSQPNPTFNHPNPASSRLSPPSCHPNPTSCHPNPTSSHPNPTSSHPNPTSNQPNSSPTNPIHLDPSRAPITPDRGLLSGHRALVTGASKGLGAVIARRLAEAGAQVAIHYHRDEAGAAETARVVEEAGQSALLLQADLAKEDEVAALFRSLRQSWPGLDLLVNNAGVGPNLPWDRVTPAEWAATLGANLTGPFLVMREALPLLRQGRGAAVVNVGSVVSFNGGSFGPAYAASKAGLIGLTRSAARDWGPLGIRVNCVAPGPLDSPLARALPAELLQVMANQTPLRRLGSFDEVAETILWLLSPRASYINGQTILVDGGRVMN